MTLWLLALITAGIALPHVLRLERGTPAAAATIWIVSLWLRALLVVFCVLYLAFTARSTEALHHLTHWCWHAVLPFLTDHEGLDGHRVGDAATIVPALVAIASVLWVMLGVARGVHAVKRMLASDSLGPGPSDSVVVGGREIILAAAGLRRPRILVSAGALLELDDEELAAGLDHERGHIARRHRFVLVFAELCRSVGRVVPGCGGAMRELRFHLERDADRWALRQSHHPYALASAICKSAETASETTWARASLNGGSTLARLGELLETGATAMSPRSRPLNVLATALVGVALVAAVLAPASAIAGAREEVEHAQQQGHCHERGQHLGRGASL